MRLRKFLPAVERLDDRIVPAGWPTAANGLPILHSRPNAPTAIYLDFDGDTTTSTTAYSEDADGTTFNLSEQTNIAECWRQMAAYYAMFDTDVTTVAPAASFPKVWMVEGNNISGGYSYVGVFPNSKPESFNEMTDTQSRVSGIAHEAGHNWGLSHQSAYDLFGEKTAEYIGQLDTLHGPIMGVDYSGQVHKFIVGHPSSSPSTLQDDLAVIANRIKAYQTTGTLDGYAPDDFAGTVAAATPLAVNGAVQSTFGIVERANDTDAFSFTASGRTFIGVTPDYPSALDARIEVYDGAGNLLAAADDAGNDQHVTLDLPAGTYYLLVAGHGNYSDIGGYNVKVAAGIPADWSSMDIGGVAKAGASTYDSATGTYTVSGGGADIWNTADEFQYAWRTLSGNGSITARVDTVTASNGYSKAGVMIRESTAAGAKNVALLATPTGGYQAQMRNSTGGSTSQINTTAGAFAVKYVRITRSGNTFTTAVSTNGTTFTTVATYSVTMNADVLVGLAVTSHNDEEERAIVGVTDVPTVNTATFDQVAVVGSLTAVPSTNALAAPTALTAAPTAAGGFSLAWTGSTGATGYTVERSANGVDYVNAGTTAAGTTSFTDGVLAGAQRYFYRVRATDAAGRSVPSDPANAVNRPSAVTGLAVTAWQADKVILNWKDTSGETGYRVERSTDNATWTTIATVGVNVPSYTATGLTAGTVYYFRVTPLSAGGDGTSATASGSSRLPAVTGLTITGTTTTQIGLSWAAVSGATGYRIDRSTDGTTFTTLTTTTTPATTTYSNTGLTPGGEYYYRVYGVNSGTGGLSALGATVFATAVAVNPLPAGWSSQDIGAVGGTGAAGWSGGTFTITGSGADIWNAADAFRFTYQTLAGNGSITAKVLTAENTDTNAKIGVMVRETLAANSKYALMAVTGDNGLYYQSRTTTGGSGTTNGTGTGLAAPYWVRLTRAGNLLTAYSSPDGVTWTTVGTSTLSALAANVYIGLAVTAHNNTLLNTSTFSNVTVGPPRVLTTKVNTGQTDITQRSRVTSLTVTFNTPVTLAAQTAATPTFTLTGTNVAGNAIAIPAAGIVVANPSGDGATYVLTFTGAGIESGSIPDGSWSLGVAAAAVTAADASHPAANYASRTSGVGIIRLFGDVTGDGFVDAADFSRFSTALGSLAGDPTYAAALDWNQDTFIDAADFSQFSGRLGLAVFADTTPQAPLPAAAAPAATATTRRRKSLESQADPEAVSAVSLAADFWVPPAATTDGRRRTVANPLGDDLTDTFGL